MKDFKGRTAVITGAASGLGLEAARIAAREAMNLVLADVQQDALEAAVAEIRALGAPVLGFRLDVSKATEVEALAEATRAAFGAPALVFNNAGVGVGGLIWEHSAKDWEWVIGVNVLGVAHGVRVFTPMMLAAARADPDYEGHVVNTASISGLQNAPNMGLYNASKHAVVAISETLYHDLSLLTDRVSCSVLCPFFVPTAITESERNRPRTLLDASAPPTRSQRVAKAMIDKAVASGKVGAAELMAQVFDAVRERRFYIYSHPQALAAVEQRMRDIVAGRNPGDPFAARPQLRAELRAALRGDG